MSCNIITTIAAILYHNTVLPFISLTKVSFHQMLPTGTIYYHDTKCCPLSAMYHNTLSAAP